jgi:hypothetical protein
MRRSLAMAAALILSACAAPSITGNELGGIVTHDADEQDEAFEQADRYCQHYARRARVRQVIVEASQIAFDCVAS